MSAATQILQKAEPERDFVVRTIGLDGRPNYTRTPTHHGPILAQYGGDGVDSHSDDLGTMNGVSCKVMELGEIQCRVDMVSSGAPLEKQSVKLFDKPEITRPTFSISRISSRRVQIDLSYIFETSTTISDWRKAILSGGRLCLAVAFTAS